MSSKYLIFDIETIDDIEAIEQSECPKWGVKTYDEYVQKMKEFNPKQIKIFVKHVFHRVVCISLTYLQFSNEIVKTTCFKGEDELEILNNFWKVFNSSNSNGYITLVTFNGKNFDMPVINLRSLKYIDKLKLDSLFGIRNYHNTSDKWENNRPNYLNRYSKYHIDLQKDIDPSYGNYFSLANICAINDIQVKTSAHGSEVQELFDKKDWDTIEKYCNEDTLATSDLLLRYLYMVENIPQSIFITMKEKIELNRQEHVKGGKK